MEWIEKDYIINGYQVSAKYTKENVETIFQPLITQLVELQQQKQQRILVFFAAPPACGKSTLVSFLCDLAKELGFDNMQYVGMDGFHYPNEYLDFHFIKGKLLREVKGCPESFDLEKLRNYIIETKTKDIDWPEYDRSIHNPKEHAIHIHKDIVLIEGNYLLLEEDGWKELKQYCDYSVYIQANEHVLEKRLIDRKAKSTNTREEAIAFYQKSDQKNIQRVLENTSDADLKLELDALGVYHHI
ncbi:MAG: nucleoside/nucleotide kinase family protein [Longicatena sp.]